MNLILIGYILLFGINIITIFIGFIFLIELCFFYLIKTLETYRISIKKCILFILYYLLNKFHKIYGIIQKIKSKI